MKIFKRSWLILLTVLLLTACCLAVPAYFIYMNARSLIVNNLGNNAIDIAVAAAAFIEKDIEKFEQLPAQSFDYDGNGYEDTSGYYDDSYYDAYYDDNYDDSYYYDDYYYDDYDSFYYDEAWDDTSRALLSPPSGDGEAQSQDVAGYFIEIVGLLDRIGAETGAASVYIEKKLSDTEKGYVFGKNSRLRSGLRTSALTEEEILAFNEGIKTSSELLSDESIGEFICGYAPVRNAAGETAGVVVVEFAFADAIALTSGVSGIIIMSFIVIIALTVLVVYRLLKSRIKYLAKDVLTELCNKRYFEKQLKSAVRGAASQKHALSLIMIDIDLFKNINDTLGHIIGDEVIKSISKVLLKHIRRDDVCCRYGGDEFIIMLPGADRFQAAKIAGRIRQETASLLFESSGGSFGVTLSIGVSQWNHAMSADMFKETADKAMYDSKNNGKDRITVFNGISSNI